MTQMDSTIEETAPSEKDYLLERGKLFSELFTEFSRQKIQNEIIPQLDKKQQLVGAISKCFERKDSTNPIKSRKEHNSQDYTTDYELMQIEIRISNYWPYIVLLLLSGTYLLFNAVFAVLLVSNTRKSVCWNFLFSVLSFLAAVAVLKGSKLCIQDWSFCRQGKYAMIYLISFVVTLAVSETFGILVLLMLILQVYSFIALLKSLSPRGTSWLGLALMKWRSLASKAFWNKSQGNVSIPNIPCENSFLPI